MEKELNKIKVDLKKYKDSNTKLKSDISEMEQEKQDRIIEIRELKRKTAAYESKVKILEKRETELEKQVQDMASNKQIEPKAEFVYSKEIASTVMKKTEAQNRSKDSIEMKPIIDEHENDPFEFDIDTDRKEPETLITEKVVVAKTVQAVGATKPNTSVEIEKEVVKTTKKQKVNDDYSDDHYDSDEGMLKEPEPKSDNEDAKGHEFRSDAETKSDNYKQKHEEHDNESINDKSADRHLGSDDHLYINKHESDRYSSDHEDHDSGKREMETKEKESDASNYLDHKKISKKEESEPEDENEDYEQDNFENVKSDPKQDSDQEEEDEQVKSQSSYRAETPKQPVHVEHQKPNVGATGEQPVIEDEDIDPQKFNHPQLDEDEGEDQDYENDNQNNQDNEDDQDYNDQDYDNDQTPDKPKMNDQGHDQNYAEGEDQIEGEGEQNEGEGDHQNNQYYQQTEGEGDRQNNEYYQQAEGEGDHQDMNGDDQQDMDGEGEGDVNLTDEEIFQIAENTLLKVAHTFLMKGVSVSELYQQHIYVLQYEDQQVPVISPEIFVEGLRALEVDNVSQIELACLMNVIVKPELENGILIEELESIIANAPQILGLVS